MKKTISHKVMRACSTMALAGAVLCVALPARSQQPTLYLGWQGGSRETLMKERVLPRFAAAHNVRVEYVAGLSTELLARLQAQRGRQDLDVVMLDDGPLYQAVSLGFCGSIDRSPILSDVFDVAQMGDAGGRAVGVGVVATGLVYNAKTFERNGWPAPTSWRDLENPRFRGREVVMSMSNTFGLHALVMFARLNGGSEQDVAPGFRAIIDRVKPNVLAWVPSAGQLSLLFQNGEVDLAAWSNGRAQALADTGFPVQFVYPSEGAVATVVGACPVAKPNANPLAQELIRYLLSPDVQVMLAEGDGLSPANRTVELPAKLAAGLPYGPDRMNSLVTIDWKLANERRGEWTRRWTREVER